MKVSNLLKQRVRR